MLQSKMRLRRRREARNSRALSILATNWRELDKTDLRSYLLSVLHHERTCAPSYGSKWGLEPIYPARRVRWRIRRLGVIEKFEALGGKVSSRAKVHCLPKGKAWPGMVHLVESRGFELLP